MVFKGAPCYKMAATNVPRGAAGPALPRPTPPLRGAPTRAYLPSNVLYRDAFGERHTLLGPSICKDGGDNGFIRQEDCGSRALLGLGGCEGREDTG